MPDHTMNGHIVSHNVMHSISCACRRTLLAMRERAAVKGELFQVMYSKPPLLICLLDWHCFRYYPVSHILRYPCWMDR